MTTAEQVARRRMPRHRRGYTASVAIAGADFYLTANPNIDGRLGEIFVKFGKQGSTLGALLDAVSISVSIGLQSGVPLSVFVSKYVDMRFEPFGMTDDPQISTCTSVLDYMFRRLEAETLRRVMFHLPVTAYDLISSDREDRIRNVLSDHPDYRETSIEAQRSSK